MVGLSEIPRTATFAWSPDTSSPFLATGTKAGAVDEGFSNETQLELWDLDLDNDQHGRELHSVACINTDSRFNDIAWTRGDTDQSRGIIAGALENGSLDLWDAGKLLSGDGNAFKSRTSKHGGAIKALQFNAFRSELLATVGAKGELFISDLNNIGSPFRMGNAVARADDFDCLDWNKRTAHILATGSSGGTLTVWDVKNKRESLTLNNLGRKPVSAIAWDPVKTTRLITAIPSDTDPVILVWDLRNANAPERVLHGHDGGILSLSWCSQDSDLLLSSGKDNRSICWNPQTGESYGEFPLVTNWTFQTRWNPHDPSLVAMASFDGKIAVQSIQSTKPEVEGLPGSHSQVVDDDDEFFNKAQSQSRGTSFNLKKAPKWLQRPCGASFGFGGKVVSFRSSSSETAKRSMVHVSTFAIDDGIVSATDAFERALKHNDLDSICESKISDASSDAERADWKVIKNLALKNPRKHLVDYLGFSSPDGEEADGESKLSINGSKDKGLQEPKDLSASTSNRLSAFFESSADGDSFLSELAATKGAKTNNPFQLYSGSESESDRRVTRALLLGEFEKALDVCLQEDRLSDAFMIAICGGQQCIDKVQKAYFNRKAEGPNYLRLLACVVGKNLWDLVHNADLSHWKEIMATLCTYADSKEFPDLCEALGDRLDEDMKTGVGHVGLRKDASFCYLAGSKLEKVVSIWINDLEEQDGSRTPKSKDSSFSVYARSLQSFIEKVTVFREAIRYQDCDRGATQDWKLAVLYEKYIEYADLASAHGQLQIAKRYLDLVPSNFPAADVAKSRVQQATRKAAPQPVIEQPTTIISRVDQRMPAVDFQQQQQQSAARPPTAASSNPYAPASTRQNPYAATNGQFSGGAGYSAPTGYQPRQQPGMVPSSTFTTPYQNQPLAPPPRNLNASPSIPPPSKAANMSNWNDTPESFFKATTSRRGTPGVGTNVPSASQSLQPIAGHSFGPPPKSTPPPPKAPAAPLPSTTSTSIVAPQQPASNLLGQPPPTVAQVTPPYNAPPSAPPPNNRYAPAQPVLSSPDQSMISGANRQVPLSSNLYAPRQNYNTPQHLSQQPPSSAGGPPRSSGLSSGPAQVPPQDSRPGTAQSQRKSPPKYSPGDRSHIPPNAQPIYELLDHDMKRVKSRAPSSFTPQVNDTEKRLNILFDHLNNEDLLKADTVVSMVELSRAIQARDFEQAQAIHVEIMTNKTDECGHWMVGVKRLIAMSRVTP